MEVRKMHRIVVSASLHVERSIAKTQKTLTSNSKNSDKMSFGDVPRDR